MTDKNYKIRSVKYNLLMSIILKISTFIFPLITLPYISRTLGAIGNGKVAFATSVMAYFSMFAQLGIPIYGIRVCAMCRDDKEELSKTVQELFIINMVSTTITFVLVIASVFVIPQLNRELPLMLIMSSSIVLTTIGIEWVYQAIEQYSYITFRNIVFKVISICLMFIFIHSKTDYLLYGIVCIIGSYGSYLLNFINARKYINFRKKYKLELKRHLKPVFVFFALSVAVSIYTNMDTVMLGIISTDQEVGYYNLAVKIKIILSYVVSALGSVLLPRISYYVKNNMKNELMQMLKKSFHFVVIISVPLSCFFVLTASQVINVLGGTEYIPAIHCMQVIMLSLMPIGLGNIACVQILAPMEMEKYTMYSTIVGAIVNFILNYFLISLFGATGAAIATVITETLVMLIQIYMSRKIYKHIIDYRACINTLISLIISIIPTILLLKNLGFNSFINLIFESAVFFGVYGVILIVLKDSLLIGFFNKLFRR